MKVQFTFTVGCYSENRRNNSSLLPGFPWLPESSSSQKFSWYDGAPVKEDKTEKGSGRDLSQAMGR